MKYYYLHPFKPQYFFPKDFKKNKIMRSFYKHADSQFNFEIIEAALDDYKSDLDSLDARIQMRFSFPMKKKSLRSNLEGFQSSHREHGLAHFAMFVLLMFLNEECPFQFKMIAMLTFCHASPSGSLMFLNEESPLQFKMMDTLKWRSLCSQERQLRSDNCNGQVVKEDLRDDLSSTNVVVIDHV